jgi:hypothetical protein
MSTRFLTNAASNTLLAWLEGVFTILSYAMPDRSHRTAASGQKKRATLADHPIAIARSCFVRSASSPENQAF